MTIPSQYHDIDSNVSLLIASRIQNLARDVTLSKLTVLQCGGLGVDSDTYWNELHTARYNTRQGTILDMVQYRQVQY